MINSYWAKPDAIREWLVQNDRDVRLSEAIAHVQNLIGYMLSDHCAGDDYRLVAAYEEWKQLNEELVEVAEKRAAAANANAARPEASFDIELYMKRNGYINANGWWIKDIAAYASS